MKIRLLFAALLVSVGMAAMAQDVAAPPAAPAATKTYAAMSLISDALEIVSYRGETGSRPPRASSAASEGRACRRSGERAPGEDRTTSTPGRDVRRLE